VFTRPDTELGTRNGSLGRVLAVRGSNLHVMVDGGRTIVVNGPRHAPAIEHAFATTVHRAQGATVEQALVYASANFTADTTFVACTRHTESFELHYDRAEFAPRGRTEHRLIDAAQTPADRLHETLSRSNREMTATEAVASGLRGRATDAAVHLRRYRAATTDSAREALKRQLEALAGATVTSADALNHHPAVAAAKAEYVAAQRQAERVAQRANARLAHVAASVPRSLRLKRHFDHAERVEAARRETDAAIRQARAQLQHAEETLKAVLAHPEVRSAAAAMVTLQAERAHHARQALEQIAHDFRPLDALHSYGLNENTRLGYPLYRAATTRDRGPDAHHRLLEFVKVESHTLAVLETDDGRRLLFPVTEKSVQWLQPGDRVGFSPKGPWLEKRNQAWADAEIQRGLAAGGLPADLPRLSEHEPRVLHLVTATEARAGVRYAVGRLDDGELRLVDLSHAPHGVAYLAGDRVRYVTPPPSEGTEAPPPRPRLVREHTTCDAHALRAGAEALQKLRAARDTARAAVTACPSRSRALAQHPEGQAVAERLQQASVALVRAEKELALLGDNASGRRPELERRCEQARVEAKEARAAALALHQREDIRMDLMRQQAEDTLAFELASARLEQLERDIPVLERDLAARAVAHKLLEDSDRPARPTLESDYGRRFIFEGEVQHGTQSLALLAAEDGHTVVMPVTGHDKAMTELRPGQLVAVDRGGRYLHAATTRDANALADEAARLREVVARPRTELEDVLRAVPEARALAEAVVRTREALRAADAATADSAKLSEARLAHRGAKAQLDRLLNAHPDLRKQGQALVDQARSEWSNARSALGKVEARLSQPERSALSLRIHHELNRSRVSGQPLARALRADDKALTLERIESRDTAHIAILRTSEGAVLTHDVSFDGAFRAKAHVGMPVIVEPREHGLRLREDSAAKDAGLARLLDQLGAERGPARAWHATDSSARFVHLGTRDVGHQQLALLAAEDGFTVARELTRRDAQLVPGQLVSERRDGGLQPHAGPYYEKLEERARVLRDRLRQPPYTLDQAFAEIPETRDAALAVIRARTALDDSRSQARARPLDRAASDQVTEAERAFVQAEELLRRASEAHPGAHQRAEQLRTEHGRQWHEASRELARIDRQFEGLRNETQQRLFHHEANRLRAAGAPQVRTMQTTDGACTFEKLEHLNGAHIAVLRTASGDRVTALADDPSVRELARPGMPFALDPSHKLPRLAPSTESDRAALHALERQRHHRPQRGRPRGQDR
jgi:hypothetical protein